MTEEEAKDMSKRISVFKKWFLEGYMKVGEQDAVLVLPISGVTPNYRDEYPGRSSGRKPRQGLRPTYLSPYIGAPELAIPSKFWSAC